MNNSQDFDPSIEATKAKFGFPDLRKSAFAIFIVVALVFGIFSWISFFTKTASKTVDDKLGQIKELRTEKKTKEQQVEELKKAIYLLDQKIIPLKCSVYSEVGAKDTWESECRDEFDSQTSKIISTTAEKLEEEVVPDYQ